MDIPFLADLEGNQFRDFTIQEDDLINKPMTLKYSLKHIVKNDVIVNSPNYNMIKELIESDIKSNYIIAYYLIKNI